MSDHFLANGIGIYAKITVIALYIDKIAFFIAKYAIFDGFKALIRPIFIDFSMSFISSLVTYSCAFLKRRASLLLERSDEY